MSWSSLNSVCWNVENSYLLNSSLIQYELKKNIKRRQCLKIFEKKDYLDIKSKSVIVHVE